MTNAGTHKAFIVALLLRAILEQNRRPGHIAALWPAIRCGLFSIPVVSLAGRV